MNGSNMETFCVSCGAINIRVVSEGEEERLFKCMDCGTYFEEDESSHFEKFHKRPPGKNESSKEFSEE